MNFNLKYSYYYKVIEGYNGLLKGETYKNALGPECPGNAMNVALLNEKTGDVTYIDKRKVIPAKCALFSIESNLDLRKISLS